MCMSLKAKEFTALRKKAMISRKERYMKQSGSEVITLPEIAAKPKETPILRGEGEIGGLPCIKWVEVKPPHSWELEEEKAQ